MREILKLIIGGLFIGLLFSLLVIWVYYIWQLALVPVIQ